ncbi:MAG TPA: arylsulfatase [Acidimicrobiales bacterium]|nr:arylsulfatase [Acidimicrobiales bacterium]
MMEKFRGVVGRTIHESTPWWPDPPRAPHGAPNVVIIVLDDVGYSDLGCFGGEISTPNMDRLANDGLRYTNFHTTALCSPTRAALLTGRNHHAVGMAVVSNWDTGFPGCRGRIAQSAGTVAEILRDRGYGTFAVGKWHLAPMEETTAAGPFEHWPLQRGFDRYYGFLDGATDHWSPDLVLDNTRLDPPRRDGYHLTEDLVDRAIDYVRDQRSVYPEKPFLLYLAFGTAHYPLHAPSASIARYRGRYDAGWDACRDARLARQKALGIVPPDTELAPRNPGVVPWEELTADERTLSCRLQETYAGMLDHTDEHLGRLLDAIEAMGAYDDTLFVLLSDNGATLEGGPMGSLNFLRYINGVPAVDLPADLARLDEIGGPTTSPMYPMGWGMVSNTPLKRYKQNTHGGGIRDPLIVTWRNRIAARGEVRPQYHHVTDIVPTILDLVGASPPESIRGIAQQPIDGVSMVSTFGAAVTPTPKVVQYFEMLGNRAIWHDGWKAVTYHAPGSNFDNDVWELYHVDADFSECHDIARERPEKLQELVDLWWKEAERNQVLPLDDRILERFHVPKPKPITSRSRFVYLGPTRIPTDGMPDVKNVSFTVTADIERSDAASDGVIVACGDRFGDYILYVNDGHLVHDYNAVGRHDVLRSRDPLPIGACTVAYSFTKTRDLHGVARLVVDGREVASAPVGPTLGTHISAVGMAIGRNVFSPVCDDIVAPFPFAGVIRRVVYDIGDDRHTPVDHALLD